MKLLKIALEHLKLKMKNTDIILKQKEDQTYRISSIITLAHFNMRTDFENILSEIKEITNEYIDSNNDNVKLLDEIICEIK